MINPLHRLKAGVRYLLSFTKDDWTLDDYPIRVRHFKPEPDDESYGRLKLIPWSAQIINWWQMDGHGDTKDAALADLRTKFEEAKREGKIPRPGTGLPLEFASQEQIRLHDDIAEDFFRRVLERNYYDCWISDQSSLWDFHGEESNAHLHEKTWETYRVDISDIEDGNLVKIFQRIENR